MMACFTSFREASIISDVSGVSREYPARLDRSDRHYRPLAQHSDSRSGPGFGLVRFRLGRVEQILDLVDSPTSVTITDFYESLRIWRCE